MDFTRYAYENNRVDTVKGQLWYYPPRHIALLVSAPMEQRMFLDSNQMILYYPKEKKAFRFRSKREFAMPFFQAFLSAREGKTSPQGGFTLKQNVEKGDTLFSLWDPPAKSRKAVGSAKVGLVKGRLAVSELSDPQGKLLARSLFRNYQIRNGMAFPMEIEIQSFKTPGVEKTFFENLKSQSALPPEIRDFQIPSDATVREVEW